MDVIWDGITRAETLYKESAAIRHALRAEPPPAPVEESLVQRVLRRTGVDITLCPRCGKGHMQSVVRPLVADNARP